MREDSAFKFKGFRFFFFTLTLPFRGLRKKEDERQAKEEWLQS